MTRRKWNKKYEKKIIKLKGHLFKSLSIAQQKFSSLTKQWSILVNGITAGNLCKPSYLRSNYLFLYYRRSNYLFSYYRRSNFHFIALISPRNQFFLIHLRRVNKKMNRWFSFECTIGSPWWARSRSQRGMSFLLDARRDIPRFNFPAGIRRSTAEGRAHTWCG